MNIKVLPGEILILFTEVKGVEKTVSSVVMAQKVCKGTIEVQEEASHNGIARIVCHGTSEASGGFWYEYKAGALQGKSFNIVKITKLNGEPIFGPFIED